MTTSLTKKLLPLAAQPITRGPGRMNVFKLWDLGDGFLRNIANRIRAGIYGTRVCGNDFMLAVFMTPRTVIDSAKKQEPQDIMKVREVTVSGFRTLVMLSRTQTAPEDIIKKILRTIYKQAHESLTGSDPTAKITVEFAHLPKYTEQSQNILVQGPLCTTPTLKLVWTIKGDAPQWQHFTLTDD